MMLTKIPVPTPPSTPPAKRSLYAVVNAPLSIWVSGGTFGIVTLQLVRALSGSLHASFGFIIVLIATLVLNASYAIMSFRFYALRERHADSVRVIMSHIMAELEKNGQVRVEPHVLEEISRDFPTKH